MNDDSQPTRRLNRFPGLQLAILLAGASIPDKSTAQPPPEKPCLVCGKPKQHNNSFCSAECCKTYKESKKNAGTPIQQKD